MLPDPFNSLIDAQNTIVNAEGGVSFLPEYVNAYSILAPDLRAKVDNATGVTPVIDTEADTRMRCQW